MNVRRGYELKTLFWGRPVRPFHLAVTVATGAVALVNLGFGGLLLDGSQALFVGWVAVASFLLLFGGWWWERDGWAEWGLLLAVGVWSSRATFAALNDPESWFGLVLSIAWVIGAGGAYLLERYDRETSRE